MQTVWCKNFWKILM